MLLLAAALTLRLAWGFVLPTGPESLSRLPDQLGYLEMGQNILAGRGLVWFDPRFADDTYAVRMPLYPLFLAALGDSIRLIRIVQAMIDTSTVLASFLLARRWLNAWPSLLAAALVAFNPFLVYFSALILTETLFTAMLLWAMVLLTAPISILWGGALLALAVLVRPSGLALPVLMGVAAVLVHPRVADSPIKRWSLPAGSAMLLLTLLVLLPWAIRNRALLGEWIWTTTNGGFVAYDGFHDQATGASDQSFLTTLEWQSRLRNLSEVQRNQVLAAAARRWAFDTARTEPLRLLALTASKIARTWSPTPLSHEYGGRRAYRFVALLYTIPFDLLVVLGLVIGALPRSAKVFLVLPAIYFTVIHALTVGSLRYRVPVEPALAVLAAAGAMVVLAGVHRPTWRRSSHSLRNNIVRG